MTCKFCGKPTYQSKFDASFRDIRTGVEHLFFSLPGAMCVPCRQLFVDEVGHEVIRGFVTEPHCTMAIETDSVLMDALR